jgi:hypothetical protein
MLRFLCVYLQASGSQSGVYSPLLAVGLPRGGEALEAGPSERVFGIFTIEVTSDQT